MSHFFFCGSQIVILCYSHNPLFLQCFEDWFVPNQHSICFSHVFLAQHAARTPHSAAGKPHLSFSNTPAVVDYDQLMGFPYQGGQRTDGQWCFWRWTLPPLPPSSLDPDYPTFTPLAALALSLMPWTCSRGRTTQWSNHVPVCFSSRFQLCGFAQRPWADQFCEFGCGTRLVKKDISVSEEGKPNKFATVHQLETYTAPLGIHIPQSGKKQFISWSFWTKTHRTGILVDFWAVERHQIHRRLRLHLHQWHHWTAKGTTVGRSNYLKSLDFVDILRIFEGKINSSPQCFLFKCFHIYVLAWFHKFQREGLLRVYLMTNMTSVLLNLRSAPPLKPPWTPPLYSILFNFINLFQKWLQFLISVAGSQGDARADVWLGRHRSFVGARTRPLEFGRLKRSKHHCFALHFGGSGLKLLLSLLTTS